MAIWAAVTRVNLSSASKRIATKPFYPILIFWHFCTIPLLINTFYIVDPIYRANMFQSWVILEPMVFLGTIGSAVMIRLLDDFNKGVPIKIKMDLPLWFSPAKVVSNVSPARRLASHIVACLLLFKKIR